MIIFTYEILLPVHTHAPHTRSLAEASGENGWICYYGIRAANEWHFDFSSFPHMANHWLIDWLAGWLTHVQCFSQF